MQAHNNTIEEFLGAPKTVFVVPVYQRNYDWQPDHCQQLFLDICGIVRTRQEHFLGTICFKVSNSHERSIIDGQQRLTSISLMLKAIHDFDEDDDIREEVNNQYLYNKGRGIDSDFLKYKIHLNKRDDVVYHILLDNPKSKVEDMLSPVQVKSRVYQNYLLFYGLIEKYVSDGGTTGDLLEALRSLTIIELEIQQENPQEIFESLNSTGLDLTNVDLLRNYFLMQFGYEQQTRLYEEYWSQVEDAVGVDRMEQFFVDYLVFKKRSDAITINGRRNHINERNLYVAFKEHYASLEGTDSYERTRKCFADLKDCAQIYKEFVFSDDINLNRETPMRRKLYYLLSVNDSGKARSLLLYMFALYRNGHITDEMLNIAVDGIASLTFRARLCKAQGVNRQFAGAVMMRLDTLSDYKDFVEAFWQAITVGRGSYAFPTDAVFRDALLHRDIYNTLRSRGTKYLLYMLEAHSDYPKGLPAFDDETMSVEHIMPQTLNAQWKVSLSKDSLEKHEANLHRLGNLALTNYNGEMSNKDFSEKKAIYQNSKFHYTLGICSYDSWQAADIEDRTRTLAEAALRIWYLPAEYQKTTAIPKSLHTLGEDTSQFTFTKPANLLIGDHDYSVNNWADFLPLLCRILDKENHEAFMELAKPEKISAFYLEDDSHVASSSASYTKINDTVYVRTFMSAASILDTVTRIAAAFDKLCGTDYAGNILFSLK